MITHPAHETLLAHVDGELSPADDEQISGHISDCVTCNTAVARLRNSTGAFASVLQSLDAVEPPHWDVGDDNGFDLETIREADRYDSATIPFPTARLRGATAPSIPARRTAIPPALRWAASIFLVAVATASAAILGRQLLATPETAGPADADAAIEPAVAAVLATPVDGTLRIRIDGAGSGARLFVTYHDAATARVAVEGGTATPRFTVVPGRVDLDLDAATAVVRLTLPRTLRDAAVVADGVTIATINLERITPAAAAVSGIPLDSTDSSRME